MACLESSSLQRTLLFEISIIAVYMQYYDISFQDISAGPPVTTYQLFARLWHWVSHSPKTFDPGWVLSCCAPCPQHCCCCVSWCAGWCAAALPKEHRARSCLPWHAWSLSCMGLQRLGQDLLHSWCAVWMILRYLTTCCELQIDSTGSGLSCYRNLLCKLCTDALPVENGDGRFPRCRRANLPDSKYLITWWYILAHLQKVVSLLFQPLLKEQGIW